MKKIAIIISAFAVTLIYVACTKSQDVIRDYADPTGVGNYPVSTNALVDLSTNRNLGTVNLSPGYSFKTELQFFSLDPIKEINFFSTVGAGARTKLSTIPYTPTYSTIKKLDTLLLPYTIPAGLAGGTSIKLDVEILNQNNLNVVRSVTIKTL